MFEPLLHSYFVDFILLGITGVLLYIYLRPKSFWADKNVPVFTPYDIMKSMLQLFYKPMAQSILEFYSDYSPAKFVGSHSFGTIGMYVRDPTLINDIMITNFSSITNRSKDTDTTSVLSKNLVNLNGDHWRSLRNKLSPTFTSGKLKGMHSQLDECAKLLAKYIKENCENKPFDMIELANRYTLQVIASTAFGLNIDTINNPESQFVTMTKKVFNFSILDKLKLLLVSLIPKLKFLITLTFKEVERFMTSIIETTLEHRQKNGIYRQDFLQLLNELKIKDENIVKNGENTDDKYIFDKDSLIANSFVFLLAGNDSPARTIAFTLYQLALNQDIQNKIYEEIVTKENKHGQFNYEALQDMRYLDQAVSETLRLHPPALLLARAVTSPYKIPDTDIVLPVGASINIPVYGLHMDPQYFPEPNKFLPERFSDESSIQKGTYLPFGAGPRMCIASRFALQEVKVCVAVLLKLYKFIPNDKTPKHPLEYDHAGMLLAPKGGTLMLSIEPRRNKTD